MSAVGTAVIAMTVTLFVGIDRAASARAFLATGPRLAPHEVVRLAESTRFVGLSDFPDLIYCMTLPVSTEQLEQKLAIAERLSRHVPDRWILERRAQLLALGGHRERAIDAYLRLYAMHSAPSEQAMTLRRLDELAVTLPNQFALVRDKVKLRIPSLPSSPIDLKWDNN